MIKSVQSLLLKGLSLHKQISLNYHGEDRIVEVHAVGVSKAGNPVARVYQVIGGAVFGEKSGWKMMKLSDMDEVKLLDVEFDIRDGYSRGDKGMTSILAEL